MWSHEAYVVLQLTRENTKAQRYLLGAFELLVGTEYRDSLLQKVPQILKAFYDYDIVDEGVIIEWDEKASVTIHSIW